MDWSGLWDNFITAVLFRLCLKESRVSKYPEESLEMFLDNRTCCRFPALQTSPALRQAKNMVVKMAL